MDTGAYIATCLAYLVGSICILAAVTLALLHVTLWFALALGFGCTLLLLTILALVAYTHRLDGHNVTP